MSRSEAALKLVPGLVRASSLEQSLPKEGTNELAPDELTQLAYKHLLEARRLAQLACTQLGYARQTRIQTDAGRAARQITDALASFHDTRA